MAKRKRSNKPRKRRSTAKRTPAGGGSHWLSMFIGLAAGLGIAAFVWWQMRPAPPLPAAASVAAIADSTIEPAPTRSKPDPIEATGEGYDFFDMLLNQEVVVSDDFAERRKPAAQRAPVEALTEAGSYLIQAGSFRSEDDAERMKAVLALQGIRANIQGVDVNGRRFHRVRIGPLDELGTVNEYRRRLRASSIDVMVMRVD